MFKQTLWTGLRMLAVLTVLTGVIYPLALTALAQLFFPDQANGSLLTRDGQVVGSALIGQQTGDPGYFWWRPSAVNSMLGSTLDSLASSGATNYGWTNRTLQAVVRQRAEALHQGEDDRAIPTDLLFASGSGLDPHISPEAAFWQVDRVAAARELNRAEVAALVEQFVEEPQLGFLGQPRVNVLRLNLALDALE